MLERSTSITLGIIVFIVIVLAGWWGISRRGKAGFGVGPVHGQPSGARPGSDSDSDSAPDLVGGPSLKEGMRGGGHGGRGRGRHGRGRGRHGRGRGGYGGHVTPPRWYRGYYGRPWWHWWRTDPAPASSWVCDWCEYCDNLDPDGAGRLCASCEAYCPRGAPGLYGL